MKTIDAQNRTAEAVLTLVGALLALSLSQLFGLSPVGWAVYLTIGAAYVTAQVRLFPDRWRSRTGSLVPVNWLLAFTWLVAVVAVAVAMSQRH